MAVLTTDRSHMLRALRLASKGRGRTAPNPMVGAVLVRNGEVVGEGWHRQHGGPHAEIEALAAAGRRARGATLYVTLEPCAHHGKTPPCADALIAAGVKRCVVALRDPHDIVNGRGLRRLRAAGLEVE
ncbi:MAG: bifunctional diaminohydroxyphosphoribosylaminopyrimidine deaminase/5-amino-6-(5-phosphoribosylamino)uracil reductase RibD, partial [Candidatus Eisenbacteria bacterium]|nr:bifunctional diaminohydroxyphosphoribosylaminopyrimidine deaminase/5-amino-6-(5-phosphoribosylamino)uracil reductase RibD [Candidatus Eisenbacteria bacterium]